MDIKETKELIVGLKKAAVIVKKIAKDGIDATDLVHIKDIADAMPALSAAVKDIDKMKEELKDLDQAEVIAIIGELYAAADELNKA